MGRSLTLLILIFSVNLSAAEDDGIIDHNQNSSIKVCPSKELEIAEEFLMLEIAGRRADKALDECYKKVTTKYVAQAKDPAEYVLEEDVVKIKSAQIKDVSFNSEYQQFDVTFVAKKADGKKVKDQFRFMRMGQAGKKKPRLGCGILSKRPSKAYVIEKCLK